MEVNSHSCKECRRTSFRHRDLQKHGNVKVFKELQKLEKTEEQNRCPKTEKGLEVDVEEHDTPPPEAAVAIKEENTLQSNTSEELILGQ